MLGYVLDGIKDVVPRLVDTVMTVIVSVLVGIDENIMIIVMYLCSIFVKAIRGLIDYMAPIVDVLMEFVVSCINALADGIRNNGQALLDAIGNVLGAIWDFIVLTLQNIISLIPGIGPKVAGYLEDLKVGVQEELDPEVAMAAGKTFSSSLGDGFVEGIPF